MNATRPSLPQRLKPVILALHGVALLVVLAGSLRTEAVVNYDYEVILSFFRHHSGFPGYPTEGNWSGFHQYRHGGINSLFLGAFLTLGFQPEQMFPLIWLLVAGACAILSWKLFPCPLQAVWLFWPLLGISSFFSGLLWSRISDIVFVIFPLAWYFWCDARRESRWYPLSSAALALAGSCHLVCFLLAPYHLTRLRGSAFTSAGSTTQARRPTLPKWKAHAAAFFGVLTVTSGAMVFSNLVNLFTEYPGDILFFLAFGVGGPVLFLLLKRVLESGAFGFLKIWGPLVLFGGAVFTLSRFVRIGPPGSRFAFPIFVIVLFLIFATFRKRLIPFFRRLFTSESDALTREWTALTAFGLVLFVMIPFFGAGLSNSRYFLPFLIPCLGTIVYFLRPLLHTSLLVHLLPFLIPALLIQAQFKVQRLQDTYLWNWRDLRTAATQIKQTGLTPQEVYWGLRSPLTEDVWIGLLYFLDWEAIATPQPPGPGHPGFLLFPHWGKSGEGICLATYSSWIDWSGAKVEVLAGGQARKTTYTAIMTTGNPFPAASLQTRIVLPLVPGDDQEERLFVLPASLYGEYFSFTRLTNGSGKELSFDSHRCLVSPSEQGPFRLTIEQKKGRIHLGLIPYPPLLEIPPGKEAGIPHVYLQKQLDW